MRLLSDLSLPTPDTGLLGLTAAWSAALTLHPKLHAALVGYLPLFSLATFALLALHCTWGQLLSGLQTGSYYEIIALYVSS